MIARMKAPGSNTGIEFSCPLTRQQAEAIYAQGREASIFVLMKLAAQVAESSQPSCGRAPSTPRAWCRPMRNPQSGNEAANPGPKPDTPARIARLRSQRRAAHHLRKLLRILRPPAGPAGLRRQCLNVEAHVRL